jgi:hypothetical protein
LARELLARGGTDADGTAYVAVTSRETADDERDLMFNQDDNVFSNWIEYDPNHAETRASKEDGSLLIRAILLAAKPHGSKKLPTPLYESTEHTSESREDICVVYLDSKADAAPYPCGHIACCFSCLTSIRDSGEGWPICRARIRESYAEVETRLFPRMRNPELLLSTLRVIESCQVVFRTCLEPIGYKDLSYTFNL